MDSQALITEIRHRVANDLALIVAVLQRRRRTSPGGDGSLDEAVGALLALSGFYRRLCELDRSVGFVDLTVHLEALAASLRLAYLDRLNIVLACRIAAVAVPPHVARDIGLIVVELVSNAAKHAFAGRAGRIEVDLTDAEDGLVCCVGDDGCGLDPGAMQRSRGGLAGAARLAAGLGGRLQTSDDARMAGVAFSLVVPRDLQTMGTA